MATSTATTPLCLPRLLLRTKTKESEHSLSESAIRIWRNPKEYRSPIWATKWVRMVSTMPLLLSARLGFPEKIWWIGTQMLMPLENSILRLRNCNKDFSQSPKDYCRDVFVSLLCVLVPPGLAFTLPLSMPSKDLLWVPRENQTPLSSTTNCSKTPWFLSWPDLLHWDFFTSRLRIFTKTLRDMRITYWACAALIKLWMGGMPRE